ncbi:MAG: replicative DNA helicase [Solitalea-like symbiont of Tyrophagus putrescentiae]
MDFFKPGEQFVDYKNKYFNSVKNNSVSEYLDIKQVPHAIDIEESVLGAIILESGAIGEIADILNPSDFHLEKHQLIYKAAIQLFAAAKTIDVKIITDKLRKNGDLEKAGGLIYISRLTNKVISSVNIETHAYLIKELSIKRQLINYSNDLNELAYDSTVDVVDLLERAENKLFNISENKIAVTDFQSIVMQSLDAIQKAKGSQEISNGIPSGFDALDTLTFGWQNSDLIIVAARPSMGKTAFMLSAVRNAVVKYGKKVAIFSLEMSALQLVNRMLAAESNIQASKIRLGDLQPEEWESLQNKADIFSELPIFINDNPSLNIFELRAECRRLKHKHNIDFIVIDYLQLMQGYSGTKHFNREQEISHISRSLKALAKELEVPVIALSQLSRAVEARHDKRPIISDLRESGSIEQDADLVLLLYRPEYYKIEQNENGESLKGLAEVIVAKHRNGPVGTAVLRFLSQYVKFDNENALTNLQSSINGRNQPNAQLQEGTNNDPKFSLLNQENNNDHPF